MSSFINDEEIVRNIGTFAETTLPNILNRALERSCLIVEGDAKRRAPYREGYLENSITHTVDFGSTTGYIGSNLEYAPYVEIGTGRQSSRGDGNPNIAGQRPQPYLKPARDNNLSKILKEFEGII